MGNKKVLATKSVICLMGPTASGKTDVAMRLSDDFPVDLVSVDSALVYRGMDIGTAKPEPELLIRYPHALVNICDPEKTYSVGDFVRHTIREIRSSHERCRIPLLVGGTMMYFRSLINGISALPEADPIVRAEIDNEADKVGWSSLHQQLSIVDPAAAARINKNDSQRIQRALEVYRVSGRCLTEWQQTTLVQGDFIYNKYALLPEPRKRLHERIEKRLDRMLDSGFMEEVKGLKARPNLTAKHSSMRAVGYKQIWSHLNGDISFRQAREQILAATRQLAKRQITWLRTESEITMLNPLEVDPYVSISAAVKLLMKDVRN